ncbi:MAG: hypothetical protein EOO58_03615, partial [Hymenobacter sp.]
MLAALPHGFKREHGRRHAHVERVEHAALVLGTEADGLTTATRQACDETVIIPMRGVLDSLNVSVAAAVL